MTTPIEPAEALMNILAATSPAIGVVGTADPAKWRLGTGFMTETPDQQIVCYDTPGQAPNPKWLLDYPVIQVMVRALRNGYKDGRAKMRDAYDALLALPPQVLGDGSRIDAITVLSAPSYIGNDQNERPKFSCNFRVIFEPTATSLSNREPL
jgi:hypothetical protein